MADQLSACNHNRVIWPGYKPDTTYTVSFCFAFIFKFTIKLGLIGKLIEGTVLDLIWLTK